MFESISDKLERAFRKFRGKGKLTEADVKEGMREIKLALLEAAKTTAGHSPFWPYSACNRSCGNRRRYCGCVRCYYIWSVRR